MRLPRARLLAVHSISRQQHLAKTRHQNLPTETGPENRAFLLSFATRRQRDTSQTPRIRASFESRSKVMQNQRLVGWGGSPARTGLRENSLLGGYLQGIFGGLG